MNNPRHTPGPWRLEGGAVTDQVYVMGVNGDHVAAISPTMGQEKRGDYDTYKRNALVIIAAPKLLESLKNSILLLKRHGLDSMEQAAVDSFEKLIAKAEGK